MVSTPPFSEAAAQPASPFEFALDLPDDFEKFFDADLVNANHILLDPFLNPNNENSGPCDPFDILRESQDTDESQNTTPPNEFLAEDIHSLHKTFVVPTENDHQIHIDPMNIPSACPSRAAQDFPDLVPQHLTELLGLNTFDDYSTLGNWNIDDQVPIQASDINSGFSAIPRCNSFIPQLPMENPQYPDPSYAAYSNGPYGTYAIQQNTRYNTAYPRLQTPLVAVPQHLGRIYGTTSHQGKYVDDFSYPPVRNGRGRTELNSNSNEDMIPSKHHKAQSVRHQISFPSEVSRRDSIDSADSSLGSPINVAVLRAGEKPKRCDEKSWIRINTSTKGATTRTARINQFSEKITRYKTRKLSRGDWETPNFKFEYHHHNGMDEFQKSSMPADQIHEYITNFPGDELRIWIQVTPGDSARRYASKTHSECIFEQCPNRVWADKGTIEVGNYRVAFDEKHKKYGKGFVDPFDCIAYAHLYCMERFLDFPSICQSADVRVDTRGDMNKEPKGEGSFTFGKKHVPERKLAEKFIKAAKVGQLHRTPEFANYPIHTTNGQPKPHERTLTYAMFQANWDHRAPSQLRQFVSRDIKPTSCGIHRGDQEIIVVDKKIQLGREFKKAKRMKTHKSFDYTRHYDRFHPEINIRMAQCLNLRKKFEREDAVGTSRQRASSKKRKFSVVEDLDEADLIHHCDDDNNTEDITSNHQYQRQPGIPQRSSPRKKQRVNYHEPQEVLADDSNDFDPMARYAPASYFPMQQSWGFSAGSGQFNLTEANDNLIPPRTRKDSFSAPLDTIGNLDSMPEQSANVANTDPFTDEELDRILGFNTTYQAP